ncbi:MAG: hypothetical protein AB9915_03175 [Candidatus Dojkabacteria bacterium]
MREGIKSLFVYILIIFMVFSFFRDGIKLPVNTLYLVATMLLLSFTVMVTCPLLNFLTIKCKFPPFFLMSSLLLIGILYLLNLFMTDLYIENFLFNGLELGTLAIKGFEVTPIITIVLSSLFISFFCGIYRELDAK